MLWATGPWQEELIQLLLLAERCDHRLHPLLWALPVPLRVHGRYSRAEILAAFGLLDERGAPRSHREGVLWDDLALGPSLFHWESQSTTAASPTGQRTIHHEARGSRVLLFVREHRRQDGRSSGITEPFRCLGFASYAGHEGERPMAIRWRLERQIPAAWLLVMGLAA